MTGSVALRVGNAAEGRKVTGISHPSADEQDRHGLECGRRTLSLLWVEQPRKVLLHLCGE